MRDARREMRGVSQGERMGHLRRGWETGRERARQERERVEANLLGSCMASEAGRGERRATSVSASCCCSGSMCHTKLARPCGYAFDQIYDPSVCSYLAGRCTLVRLSHALARKQSIRVCQPNLVPSSVDRMLKQLSVCPGDLCAVWCSREGAGRTGGDREQSCGLEQRRRALACQTLLVRRRDDRFPWSQF